MHIREAGEKDAALLSGIIRDSFRDVAERFHLTRDNCPSHPSFSDEKRVESSMARGVRFFVLRDDGLDCGCVALEQADEGVCYLERLAVLPPLRRRGYGEALVRHVFDRARELGAGRVEIGIISDHLELAEWYGGLGFVHKERARFEQLPFEVTFMFVELR